MQFKSILNFLCVVQMALLVYVLYSSDSSHIAANRNTLDYLFSGKELQVEAIDSIKEDIEAAKYRLECLRSISNAEPGGAVLLLLTTKSPSYFHLLSFKINNLLQNIPSNWIILIFYVKNEAFLTGVASNPGFQRHLEQNKRIFAKEIPISRTLRGNREDHYRLQPWLWKYMVTENVLVVDGK